MENNISDLCKALWDKKKIDVYTVTINKGKYIAVADQTVNGDIATIVEVVNKRKHVALDMCINRLKELNLI